MIWSGKYRVNANDTDCNNIVSASAILRFMQDAANSEMAEDGPSYDSLIDSGYTFILSKININLYSPLYTHDIIEAQSWACESKGYQSPRCYRILRDGNIIAEAVSVWALCSIEDRKPHRMSEFEFGYRKDELLELDLPSRFRIPDDVELHLNGERTVEYADIDLNRHMNNTRYPDLLCSYLGRDMLGFRPVSMCISFVSEAHLKEKVSFYAGEKDGTYFVRSIKGNGQTNVEAQITLGEIK